MKSLSGGLVHALPDDLSAAIHEGGAVLLWESLTDIGRNEFICWIEDAKQQKTRVKRIARAVKSLEEGKKRPCCWPGCIHRKDKEPGKWQQAVLLNNGLEKAKR